MAQQDDKKEGGVPDLECEIITLFPELFDSYLSVSLLGKAIARGQIVVHRSNPRDFVPVSAHRGSYRPVDDTPYGGGPGMVMRPEPIVAAVEHATGLRGPAHRILLAPHGSRFDQAKAAELCARRRLLFICGRYEGIDHRVELLCVDEVLSIGDYVLSGGELAAAVVIEAVARLVPGVLGSGASVREESYQPAVLSRPAAATGLPVAARLLEYPQWTRPPEFRGLRVPEVLMSGDHARIASFRAEEALRRTQARRPDLLRQDDDESKP